MIASRRSPHERLEGALHNVHLRAELRNCLERALKVVDSRADGGRDLTILGIDKRGDLLQEDEERRCEAVKRLAFDDWLSARGAHCAIERGQRLVISAVGVVSIPPKPFELVRRWRAKIR